MFFASLQDFCTSNLGWLQGNILARVGMHSIPFIWVFSLFFLGPKHHQAPYATACFSKGESRVLLENYLPQRIHQKTRNAIRESKTNLVSYVPAGLSWLCRQEGRKRALHQTVKQKEETGCKRSLLFIR